MALVQNAALVLLSGCTPYWVQSQPSLEVGSVQTVSNVYAYCPNGDYAARTKFLGCTMRGQKASIYISDQLTKEQFACVLAHELRHAQGWQHDERPTYRLDCGD